MRISSISVELKSGEQSPEALDDNSYDDDNLEIEMIDDSPNDRNERRRGTQTKQMRQVITLQQAKSSIINKNRLSPIPSADEQ